LNVLNAIKNVPEVCHIFCATANSAQIIVADLAGSRAVLGVADGECPKGIEGKEDIAWRKNLLRQIGYKE
jgi:adenosine/AMP kinase